MLTDLFPRCHARFSSRSIFGSKLEDFAVWLSGRGYHRGLVRRHVRTTKRLDRELHIRGCHTLRNLTRERLLVCCPRDSQEDCYLASTVRLWERYLDDRHLLPRPEPKPKDLLISDYCNYLREIRGASESTLTHHAWTTSRFLVHAGYDEDISRLERINRNDVETFVHGRAKRANRASLQHEIAHVRSFLRFLAARGKVQPGLDGQIDTPRLYRGERLPRSLPWDTVRDFLASIDRSTPMGRRDYAIFLLIATYGLRCSEIVTLKLDDIHWRAGTLHVPLRKMNRPLLLPLTDPVGESLLDYLRHGRPSLPYREVFLRCHAPAGLLKPTAVTEAFQAWTRRGGLNIPYQGPHCLRHSYAVHLLRQGVSLKTIGDLLGHRNAESTCVYIRLAVEDLRDVALCLPRRRRSPATREVS